MDRTAEIITLARLGHVDKDMLLKKLASRTIANLRHGRNAANVTGIYQLLYKLKSNIRDRRIQQCDYYARLNVILHVSAGNSAVCGCNAAF